MSALLAAGVSLLGSILGKPKNKYVIPPYQKIRDAAEAAGIHPMFALSAAPGQVVQTGGIPGLGQAFGDAASALAGAINQPKSQQAQAVNERLVTDNQRLSRQLTRFTLRPPQPGLFERSTLDGQTERADYGSSGAVAGNFLTAGQVSRGVPYGRRSAALDLRSPIDPRYNVRSTDVVADPGFSYVDNEQTGRRFAVPSFNGEILDIGQFAVLTAAKTADAAAQQHDIRQWARSRPVLPFNHPLSMRARSPVRRRAAFEQSLYWTGFSPAGAAF